MSLARAKGLGLGLAFEAEFESLPPTLSIVADTFLLFFIFYEIRVINTRQHE